MTNSLPQHIQALLFSSAEPQTYASLASRLSTDVEGIKSALIELDTVLQESALILVSTDIEVSMVIRPEYAELIKTLRKEELSQELSKASAETLSIVVYRPGITKADIEFIRGVNTSYSLRALSMRGLIESRGGGRSVTYHPSIQVLQHFGISRIEELPHYEETVQKLHTLLEQSLQQ